MECANCYYMTDPASMAVSGSCPNCGIKPESDQPNPLHSDMEMRNMPAPGESDMGGNPLKEGILGDWQNRQKRDESFASVQKEGNDLIPDQGPMESYPPDAPFPVDPGNIGGEGVHEPCPMCGGQGASPMGAQCPECMGQGTVPYPLQLTHSPDDPLVEQAVEGPHYQGSWNTQMKESIQQPEFGTYNEHQIISEDPRVEMHSRPFTIDPVAEFTQGKPCHNCGTPLDPTNGLVCPGCGETNFDRGEMRGQVDHPDQHTPEAQEDMLRYVMEEPPTASWDRSTHSQKVDLPWYASEKEPEVDFEVEEVVEPDPKSIKDKELKKEIKEGGVLGDVWNGIKGVGQDAGDFAQGVVQGGADVGKWAWNHPLETAGLIGGTALIATGVGAPEGAAIDAAALGAGAGEAAGAGAAAGEVAAGGAAAGGEAAGVGLPGAVAEGAATPGVAGRAAGWMKSAMSPSNLGKMALGHEVMNTGQQGAQAMMGIPPGGQQMAQPIPPPRTVEQIAHTKTADDFESPSSHDEIPNVKADNPEVDPHEKKDGDRKDWQKDFSTSDEGDASRENATTFGPDAQAAYEMMFPLIFAYSFSDEDGSKDPLMKGLHEILNAEIPNYLDHSELPDENEHEHSPSDENDEGKREQHTDNTDADEHREGRTAITELPGAAPQQYPEQAMMPGMMPPQIPGVPQQGTSPAANQGHCINGHTVNIDTGVCPQCGAPAITPPQGGAGLQPQAAWEMPQDNSIMYEGEPDIPPGMTVDDYRGLRPDNLMPRCPNCGETNHDKQVICPRCGFNQERRTASDHQGPHTPEQLAAVSQLLQQQGREQEIPDMILEPWRYAQELASIQNNPDTPDADGNAGPPMPAQEEAPPQDTMPVPPMSAPQDPSMAMSSVLNRYGADSVAGQCPKCKGHSTGLVDQESGQSRCHSCGNTFKTQGLVGDDGGSTDLVTTAGEHDHEQGSHPNFEGVPAADQEHQEDVEKERDTSLTWTDEDGAPLKVGQQYQMFSTQYDIPDIVRIEAVRPESIEYSLVGTYGLAQNTKVTWEESQLDGLNFRAVGDAGLDNSNPEFDIEQNPDEATGAQGEFGQHDLSTPHQLSASTKPNLEWLREGNAPQAATEPVESVPDSNPGLDWLREGGDFLRTSGAQFTSLEQRDFIDEPGEARNQDKLNLAGTHYEEVDDDSFLFGVGI